VDKAWLLADVGEDVTALHHGRRRVVHDATFPMVSGSAGRRW
jgi:hypothetical protein